MRNLYQVLGVAPGAPAGDIAKNYKRLALKYHPDKNPDAEALFKTIAAAYAILGDDKKRERYNRTLTDSECKWTINSMRAQIASFEDPVSTNLKTQYLHCFVRSSNARPPKRSPASDGGESGAMWRPPANLTPLGQPSGGGDLPAPTARNAFAVFGRAIAGQCDPDAAVPWLRQVCGAIDPTKFAHATVEAMLAVCTVPDSDLFCNMCKICESVVSAPSQPLLAALFDGAHFRNVVTLALRGHRAAYDIDVLFASRWDDRLEKDVHKTGEASSLHVLHQIQTKLRRDYETACQDDADVYFKGFRDIAYWLADYAMSKTSAEARVNMLLSAALFLREGSLLRAQKSNLSVESDFFTPFEFADEVLILAVCKMALCVAASQAPFLDFYGHFHCLNLLKEFRFHHADLSKLIYNTQQRVEWLATACPCASHQLLSTIDLQLLAGPHNSHLRKYCVATRDCERHDAEHKTDAAYVAYLFTLWNWGASKGAQQEKDDNDDEPERDAGKAESRAGEAGGASTGDEHDANNSSDIHEDVNEDAAVQSQRFALMELLVPDTTDIMRNMHAAWNAVAHDALGYWKPEYHAAADDGEPYYKTLDGFEIHPETGQIDMAFTPWRKGQDPLWQRAFRRYDVRQLFHRNVFGTSFSLDSLPGRYAYHPCQKKVLAPASAIGTDYAFTVFQADYWLKMFTQGVQMQAHPPFETRPLDLAHLPQVLQDAMHQLHAHRANGARGGGGGSSNRFWIEAGGVATLQAGKQFTLGQVHMCLRTKRTTVNIDGATVDEGDGNDLSQWVVFRAKSREALQPLFSKTKPGFHTLVFILNSDDVHYFEAGKWGRFPKKVDLGPHLRNELLLQKLDPNGGVMRNDENRHFLYLLTTYVCAALGRPHGFTAETVFAEEFTKHYDLVARHYPVFERLRQLSKVVAMIREANRFYDREKILQDRKRELLDSADHWKVREREIALEHETSVKVSLDSAFAANKAQFGARIGSVAADIKQNYRENFADERPAEHALDLAAAGDASMLATEVGAARARAYVAQLLATLASDCERAGPALAQLEALGVVGTGPLGFEAASRYASEHTSEWVPSVSIRTPTGFVWGGVRVEPTLVCRMEAHRYSLGLTPPSCSYSNGKHERWQATAFLNDLKRAEVSCDYRANTDSLKRMIADIERSICTNYMESKNSYGSSASAFAAACLIMPRQHCGGAPYYLPAEHDVAESRMAACIASVADTVCRDAHAGTGAGAPWAATMVVAPNKPFFPQFFMQQAAAVKAERLAQENLRAREVAAQPPPPFVSVRGEDGSGDGGGNDILRNTGDPLFGLPMRSLRPPPLFEARLGSRQTPVIIDERKAPQGPTRLCVPLSSSSFSSLANPPLSATGHPTTSTTATAEAAPRRSVVVPSLSASGVRATSQLDPNALPRGRGVTKTAKLNGGQAMYTLHRDPSGALGIFLDLIQAQTGVNKRGKPTYAEVGANPAQTSNTLAQFVALARSEAAKLGVADFYLEAQFHHERLQSVFRRRYPFVGRGGMGDTDTFLMSTDAGNTDPRFRGASRAGAVNAATTTTAASTHAFVSRMLNDPSAVRAVGTGLSFAARGLTVAAAVVDAISLCGRFDAGFVTGDFRPARLEAARIGAAWPAAVVGGRAAATLASLGLRSFSAFAPVPPMVKLLLVAGAGFGGAAPSYSFASGAVEDFAARRPNDWFDVLLEETARPALLRPDLSTKYLRPYFRGDRRAPFDYSLLQREGNIFAEGFYAKGSDMDVGRHLFESYVRGESGFVATSYDPRVSIGFPAADFWDETWLYKLRPTRSPVNATPHARVGRAWLPVAGEPFPGGPAPFSEMAFPQHIPAHEIEGAWRVGDGEYDRTVKGEFIPNPNFKDPHVLARKVISYNDRFSRALAIAGAALDGVSLSMELADSWRTGDWTNSRHEIGRITSAWTLAGAGSAVGSWAFAGTAQLLGATPLTKVVCSVAGQHLGGFLGYSEGPIVIPAMLEWIREHRDTHRIPEWSWDSDPDDRNSSVQGEISWELLRM